MARLAAALLLLAAAIGASGQLVIEDAKRQVGSPRACERAPPFPQRAPPIAPPPPWPQIDLSDFVVHEQLQLSVRNDGRDAAPSLLLCDRNLARAAYFEVGSRCRAAIAGWRLRFPPPAPPLLPPVLPALHQPRRAANPGRR